MPNPGRNLPPGAAAETPTSRRHDGPAAKMVGMKTRTLMLLALVTGLAILAAGAIQILMAGR